MRKWLLILGVVIIATGGWFLRDSLLGNKPPELHTPDQPSETRLPEPEGEVVAEIKMGEEAYSPNEQTIKAGQAIRFVNASSANRWPASNIHPTHELYPEFDPRRELKPGESWVFTFRNKGTWRLHDHIVPYIKGVITVE